MVIQKILEIQELTTKQLIREVGQVTEQEAIEALKIINLSRVHPFYDWEEMAEVRDMAIEALKEVRQYREIGTVEECKELASIIKKAESNELAKVIDEWIKYKKIGTVEECREAVEKQKPKMPDYEGDGYADGEMVYDTWICPNCGKKYEVDYDDYKHCPNCGQAIDENLEGMEDGT